MALSNEQIDRYSRQIITHGMGGAAQNRILDSKALITGEFSTIELAARYLAGAGVGTLFLDAIGADSHAIDSLCAQNPDSRIVAPASPADVDMIFAVISSAASHRIAVKALDSIDHRAAIIVREDTPAMVAILPSRSPCPRCADPRVLGLVTAAYEHRGLAAMLAAAEALKLLGDGAAYAAARVVEFDGIEAATRETSGDPKCACHQNIVRARDAT
jgi:hypothetical protein